jgi:hypothetical protein
MRDDTEAIFVIVPLGADHAQGRKIAFHTVDPDMIAGLEGVCPLSGDRFLGRIE